MNSDSTILKIIAGIFIVYVFMYDGLHIILFISTLEKYFTHKNLFIYANLSTDLTCFNSRHLCHNIIIDLYY